MRAGRRRRYLRRGGRRARGARLPRRPARHARGPLAARRLDHAGFERSLRHALDATRRAAHSSADGKLKPVGAPDDARTDVGAINVADAEAVDGAHAAPDARARAPYGGTSRRTDSKTNASAVRGAVGEAHASPVAAADAVAFARADAAADATPVAGAEPLSDHAGAVTSADDVASSDDVAGTISSTDDAGAFRRADARTDACADSWAYA